MLKELFEAISEQAIKSESAKVIKDYGNKLLYRSSEGNLGFEDVPPPARAHKAIGIVTITEFAKRFAAHQEVEVWYSRRKIVCLTDSKTRWDRVEMVMEVSDQLNYLAALEKTKPMLSQKELILRLRTTLYGSLGRQPELLNIVRRVKFSASQEGHAAIEHGKSSVGRRIESEIVGTGAIPEYVDLQCPVFINFPTAPATIRCALEVHADTQNFQLIPLPGEIERSLVQGEDYILSSLIESVGDSNNIHIYYGDS